MLPDRSWRISYSSNENNPIAEFYVPALECAVQYDRKSGFFNSAILSKVARGLGAMLYNQGKIRLIMGCQFSPADLEAIEKGYALREVVTDRLATDLQPPTNFVQLKHLEILSWLIETGSLDIKIAIPLKTNGMPTDDKATIDTHHIFHEKVGIFTDAHGHKLVFSGSNNESVAGWEHNVESFHVYCDWEGGRDQERVAEEIARFDRLWLGSAPNVSIFELPEAVRRKLLTYTPKFTPDWNPQIELDIDRKIEIEQPTVAPVPQDPDDIAQEQQLFNMLANLHQHPGCLDFCLKSIPISPWAHQLKILRRVAANFPCNFLIADEVGLGKTIETGLILKYLLTSQKVQRVLLLVPASVQVQWQQELREKFNLHFWSYSQGEFTSPDNTTITPTSNPWNTTNLILASSHLIRRSVDAVSVKQNRAQELLAAEPWDLVILDEAHHARRRSPQQRKDTPNRLLSLLQKLKDQTKSLVLLSATPMQIDPVEIFDLLNLLGLAGHWSYSENFCDYFATLSNSDITKETLNFWQQMSTDYFRRGGKPCSRLDTHLNQQDKLLAHRLQDTWQTGRKSIDYKQCIKDTAFIAASRQYLTTNTPLKDIMFRHTRDTLREYYRHGILDKDIPTRIVSDNAIILEPQREAKLYQAVSDYVRHFYQLAQKENRKALGFLMTLYRKRLTSSFYAVQESLKRRLAGISVTNDDLNDLDDADDSVIQGLEAYLAQPTDPREIAELEKILRQFENTGEDSKLSNFLIILRQELNQRESAIVFTQYTDTMDYLRDNLHQLYGSQVACYSGRGGEIYQGNSLKEALRERWVAVSKEQIKSAFRAGEIKVLLCTESACEGLNLQTCSVLLNYDMPWNPMRVEQRIGRIDRIGQLAPTVKIHNFYYDGTVEAKVYLKLRDRIDAFQSVVGNLQPILAQVPNFIEQAVMSADPEEEGVLLAEFDKIFDAPPLRPAIDDLVAMDVVADLTEISQPLSPSPITSAEVEHLFTTSCVLKSHQINFELIDAQVWKLCIDRKQHIITFDPIIADVKGIKFLNYGEPLFDRLLSIVTS